MEALAISPGNPSSVGEFEEHCLAQALQMFEAHLAVNRFRAASADGGDDHQHDKSSLTAFANRATGLIQVLARSVRSSTAVLSGNAAAHSVREGCSVATRDPSENELQHDAQPSIAAGHPPPRRESPGNILSSTFLPPSAAQAASGSAQALA